MSKQNSRSDLLDLHREDPGKLHCFVTLVLSYKVAMRNKYLRQEDLPHTLKNDRESEC